MNNNYRTICSHHSTADSEVHLTRYGISDKLPFQRLHQNLCQAAKSCPPEPSPFLPFCVFRRRHHTGKLFTLHQASPLNIQLFNRFHCLRWLRDAPRNINAQFSSGYQTNAPPKKRQDRKSWLFPPAAQQQEAGGPIVLLVWEENFLRASGGVR